MFLILLYLGGVSLESFLIGVKPYFDPVQAYNHKLKELIFLIKKLKFTIFRLKIARKFPIIQYDFSIQEFKINGSFQSVFIVLFLLVSSRAMSASTSETNNQLKNKNASQSVQSVETKNETEIESLDQYLESNYEMSLKLLDTISESKLSVDGLILKTMTLIQLKKYNSAKRVFQKVSMSEGLTKNQNETIITLIQKNPFLKQETEESTHKTTSSNPSKPSAGAYVDFAIGSNDNIYSVAASSQKISSTYFKSNLNLSYNLNVYLNPTVFVDLDYEQTQKTTDLTTLNQSGGFRFNHEGESIDWSFETTLEQTLWANQKVKSTTEQRFNFDFNTEDFTLGFWITRDQVKSLNTNYSYLQGTTQLVQPYIYYYANSFYTQLYALNGLDGTQDLQYSNGDLLPLSHQYQGFGLRHVFKLSSSSRLQLKYQNKSKTYTQSSLPENKKRLDKESLYLLKYSIPLSKAMTFYIFVESIKNQSTLIDGDVSNKNYQSQLGEMGLQWQY